MFRDNEMICPKIDDSVALRLRQRIQAIQKGKIRETYGWTTKVPATIFTGF